LGKGKGHLSIRTCIICRSKAFKGELFRLAVDDLGQVVLDRRSNMPGRGGYICKNRSCLEKLKNNNRLNKVFKREKKLTFSQDFEM